MLKHAVLTAVQLDRLPPEKRVSVVGAVLRRRRSSAFQVTMQMRRMKTMSWPSSSVGVGIVGGGVTMVA